MSDDNKWSQPASPPPPLFTGQKEKDFVKQVNDELIERVIGQEIVYYPLDIEHTNYHPLYGEAIEKTFLPPVRVHALIEWEGLDSAYSENIGIDKVTAMTIHFHKRRLTEDQDLYVREGDMVFYGSHYYQIVSLKQPTQLFGQSDYKMEIAAKCIIAREGTFDAR